MAASLRKPNSFFSSSTKVDLPVALFHGDDTSSVFVPRSDNDNYSSACGIYFTYLLLFDSNHRLMLFVPLSSVGHISKQGNFLSQVAFVFQNFLHRTVVFSKVAGPFIRLDEADFWSRVYYHLFRYPV